MAFDWPFNEDDDAEPLFGGRFSMSAGINELLLCPVCGPPGQGYLHQDGVEVFFRCEDAEDGLRVSVSSRARPPVKQDRNQGDNPSPRRDGLWIRFWCESCESRFRLGIWQHKGQTFMRWDPKSAPILRGR